MHEDFVAEIRELTLPFMSQICVKNRAKHYSAFSAHRILGVDVSREAE